MKIVHFVRHFHPRLGGVEKHVFNVVKEQQRQGLEVEVITEQYEGMTEYEEYLGIKIFRSPALRSPLRNWFWHLKHIGRYRNADVLHFHNLEPFESVPFWFVSKTKVVLTMHGWGGVFPIPKKDLIRVKRDCSRYASRFITVGHFVNKWYDLDDSTVIYGAVDSAFFKENTHSKVYDICIFGRLEQDAGIPIYIKAICKLIEEYPSRLKICIVGDGSMQQELLKALEGADVDFLGFVKQTQPYLEKSKVCFTSGYLGILECLASHAKVCSVYDNPLKEDYLKLSPYAPYINITDNHEELFNQISQELSEFDNEASTIPAEISRLDWRNIVSIYQKEYEKLPL